MFNVRKIPSLTYSAALSLLNGKDYKPLCRETFLEHHNLNGVEEISVRHWDTRIIHFYPDDSIRISLNGWYTPTTMKRVRSLLNTPGPTARSINLYKINGNLCVFVYKDKPDWRDAITYLYQDGILIKADGSSENPTLLAYHLSMITGHDVENKDCEQIVRAMNLKQLIKLWRKGRRHYPNQICQYCDQTFLPALLTMAGEGGVDIIQERLREAA